VTDRRGFLAAAVRKPSAPPNPADSCTSCAYCMPCPFGLDIPSLLLFWSENRTKGDLLARYEAAFPPLRRAERCTECGQCRAMCPQLIDIPAVLVRMDAVIEDLRRNR